jgi:hypothetical protein
VFADQLFGLNAGPLGEVLVSNPTIEWRLPLRNAGGLQMPPASSASARVFSPASSILKGVCVAILRSLQKSRRREARRIIREHRHLIAAKPQGEAGVPVTKRRS